MTKSTRRTQRGGESLSRERIIDAAIALLDRGGEAGFTFRALSEALATGAGAIYWHVASKDALFDAACDAVVERAMRTRADGASEKAAPRATILAIGAGMFDALDAHPWAGTRLGHAAAGMPLVRLMEGIGREVAALGVKDRALWLAGTTLLNYILGVAGQNAANSRFAREQGMVREDFLDTVADAWSHLDAAGYPFTRAVATHLRAHDDRIDFLAGIDLILDGIAAQAGR